MSVNEIIERINKRSEENRKKMNEQIDKFKTAYIIENSYGDRYVFSGVENGLPVYRCNGQLTHAFGIENGKIIQKYNEG